jgi:DNA polymerase elongation subunit (family B)
MTTNQGKKILVKTKKIVATKSFRLFDFHIYDECPSALLPSQKEDEDAPTKREQKQFIIQMFGINETGETCSITITDFQPYFYVKVGDDWTRAESTALHMDICKRVGYMASSILSANLEEHKKLYGFSAGKKYKFVKFTFANTVAMNKVKNMWYGNDQNGERCRQPFRFKGINLELYESNIPPLLRYFHIHEISPSGWVQIFLSRTQSPAQKTTTCNYEYVCALSALQPIKDKETRVPYKICSFDIEASSSHGDFPIPIKSYKRLAMNMVDCFNKEDLSQMNMKSTITKMVMAAFGHDSYRGIDLVYPKNADEYTKEDIKKRISILLSTSVQDVKKMTSEETKAILCIDDMFKQMTETFDAGEGGEEGAEEGEGEEAPPATPYPVKKTPAKKMAALLHTTPEYTIIHVIESKDYDRDEKIKIINETMVNIFPKLEGDKVTFIGSTFLNYGDVQPYKNHCLVLGTCDDVEGAIIETTDTESELLLKWTELIQKENPDIIIGYNIFGFDYEFMFRRAQENHCERQFLLFSRKMNEICAKMTESDTGRQELQIENTKVVLASGEYDLRYYKAAGRLQIDMYTYFRRDFNLPSYKLDDVAGQYISDSVKKTQQITHEKFGKVTELYSSNLTGLNVNDFIHIEISNFTSDYLEDGKKFRVLDIYTKTVEEPVKGTDKTQEVSYNVILIGGHPTIDHTKTIKWGMAKDDVSPQDIFRLSNGSAADRAIVAKYCIQDCNLVHHLMNKIDVLTGYVEMSRICSVPISFLVFRGQGIKLTSYVAKKCREKETLMPDLEKTKSFDEYEGAIVLPPKCSMYMDNPVACVDYASLYPSSMISNNLSQDSKVWTKEYDLAGNLIRETGEKDKAGNYIYDGLPGYEYVDVTFDSFKYTKKTPTSKAEKVKSGIKVCRWAQLPNNQKSIMPAILEELLKARSDTRKLAKTIKDPFMQNILDKRQLGYKVTANSLYGQCGAKTSTFYEQDVAACTTATGRMMIMYAKRIIEEVYGNREYETKCHGLVRTRAEYVYGDTDSVFFTFNLEDPKTGEKIRGKKALEVTIEIAQDAAHLCTQSLKPPMELAYEKTLMPFVLLSKKRYVGMLYETDPNKGKLKYMGLSLKRRDSCDYLKDVYGEILNILMKENDIKKSIDFLDKALNDLVEGNVPMEKLMITRALRSDYKNPNQIAHKVLADRIGKRDQGNEPKPGDRMRFVFIQNNTPRALLGDRIETPEYILENKINIDYTYYITNQLMKPLQQLFGLAVEKIWEFQKKQGAIKTYRKDMEKMEKDFGSNYEVFMKRKEKYCSLKIKALLFDKILNKIANKRNNIQMITNFFN